MSGTPRPRYHEGKRIADYLYADTRKNPNRWRYWDADQSRTIGINCSFEEANRLANLSNLGLFCFIVHEKPKNPRQIRDYLIGEYDIDPDAGTVKYAKSGPESWRIAGKDAGSPTGVKSTKYQYISVQGSTRPRSHWIWLYVHGEFPPSGMYLDHINRNSMDDRIENLRLATRSENMLNLGITRANKSGRKGVFQMSRCGRYRAQLTVNGKNYIKDCATFEEAVVVRSEFERLHAPDWTPPKADLVRLESEQ